MNHELSYGKAIVRGRNFLLQVREDLSAVKIQLAAEKQEYQSRTMTLDKRTTRYNGLAAGHRENVSMLEQVLVSLHQQ